MLEELEFDHRAYSSNAADQNLAVKFYLEAMRLFEDYDLLIAPATPVQATPIGAEWITIDGHELPCRPSLGLLTQPISCIGLPVCVAPLWPYGMPGALSPDSANPAPLRLPIGVQLIAAPWREDICLAAAQALEQAGIATCRIS